MNVFKIEKSSFKKILTISNFYNLKINNNEYIFINEKNKFTEITKIFKNKDIFLSDKELSYSNYYLFNSEKKEIIDGENTIDNIHEQIIAHIKS